MGVPAEYKDCGTWNSTVKRYKKLNPTKSFKESLVGAKSIWKEIKKTTLNIANLPNRIVKTVTKSKKARGKKSRGKTAKKSKKSKRKSKGKRGKKV